MKVSKKFLKVLHHTFILLLAISLQKNPRLAWGDMSIVRIDLGQEQIVFESYELGENDYLELHNSHALPIQNIEVVNWLSGKRLMSIKEIAKDQSAKIQFEKGTYIFRYLIADGKENLLSRQFQVEVKAKVIL